MNMHQQPNPTVTLSRSLGTWHVMVSGVALVVAASTLVSDFSGFFSLGSTFIVALLMGFFINLLLALSAADLSTAYPRAGGLYHYAQEIFPGKRGEWVGLFLGLTFFGMFAFAVSGETAAGALGLRALTGLDLPLWILILALGIASVVPNLLGIKTAAWASAALLLLMLGIRWFFGLAGFLGVSRTGRWQLEHLDSEIAAFQWFGDGGVLASGLAIAFWSFVGIEFACSLAEEVKEPRRAMPRGLILGLTGILITSLVMGLGVTGTQELSIWRTLNSSALGGQGEAPQLAVGHAMFGHGGYLLMALASVAATLGTLTVAYAAMPRILFSMARDGRLPAPISKPLKRLHPRFGSPIAATLVTFGLFQIPAIYNASVIDWIYSAAYAWILLYIVFHLLAIANRRRCPHAEKAFRGHWFTSTAYVGIGLTALCLYFAFKGNHVEFGSRAFLIFLAAFSVTALSMLQSRSEARVGSPIAVPTSIS